MQHVAIKYDDIVTGFARIDADHKRLLDMINLLCKARSETLRSVLTTQLLTSLLNQLASHFEHEEEFMARLEFGNFDRHLSSHCKIINSMTLLVNQYDASGDLDHIINFMTTEISGHIADEDKQFASFIRQRRAKQK